MRKQVNKWSVWSSDYEEYFALRSRKHCIKTALETANIIRSVGQWPGRAWLTTLVPSPWMIAWASTLRNTKGCFVIQWDENKWPALCNFTWSQPFKWPPWAWYFKFVMLLWNFPFHELVGESTLKLRYSTCRDGGFLEIGGAVKRVAKAARSLAASFAVHIKNEFVPLVSHSTFVSEKKKFHIH